MKVLITGSRYYADRQGVYKALDTVHQQRTITLLIHGACSGADRIASCWARSRHVQQVAVRAKWEEFQLAAGPMRNQQMLEMAPDLVVAFPGGKGTRDMLSRARKAKVQVLEPVARTFSYG